MHDPVAVGRRTAHRALAIEAIVVTLVALAFLAQGPQQALAAAVGGAAVVLGNALAAFVALGGGIQSGRTAFARLLLGTLGKWAVVMGVLAISFGVWRIAPFPVLVGVVVSMLAYLLGFNFSSRFKRER